jgi:sterol 24-C-methyltransferase
MCAASRKVDEFQQLAADRESRVSNYAAMVNNYYDLVGRIYEKGWGQSHHFPIYKDQRDRHQATWATERELADIGGFAPDMKVLDVGSGIGGPAMTIAAHSGAHVTGVEIVKSRVDTAIATAKKKCLTAQTTFQVGDMMRLAFNDASFDAAYSFEALCHTPDKIAAYREVVRILKPGGVFIGYDWLRAENLTAKDERYIEDICRCHAIPYLNTLTRTRVDLAAAGFDVITLCDAAMRGDVAQNWVSLRKSVNKTKMLPTVAQPRVLRMMTRGAEALCDAGNTGAFVIGFFHARRPADRRPVPAHPNPTSRT